MSMYPENWPRCVSCGDHALDGHLTCGRSECNEGLASERLSEDLAGSRCGPDCGWCGRCS